MDYFKHISRRLRTLGVSFADSRSVASWYIQQIRCRGKVGAISYLKSVGDTILWYLYGSPEKPAWVATKHRFPKAVYCLRRYSDAILLRVAKFARAITLDEVTPGQKAKVVTAAVTPFGVYPYDYSEDSAVEEMGKVIHLGLSLAGLERTSTQPSNPPLIGKEWSRFKSVSGPVVKGIKPPIAESIEIVNMVPALAALPYWRDTFYPINPTWLEDQYERYVGAEHHSVGEIHAAQEGGGKLRMYASPHSVVQCLLSPIHDWVDKFERTIPTSCRYDQEAGANWAAKQLREGRTVYSVDLSTATCRFPLKVQMELLRSLGLADVFCEALEWACTGEWVVGDELRPLFPETMSWQVGQPLGIRPSMSMFSLAHNLLILGLCHITNSPEDFRILGDDVVMCGEVLFEAYTSLMRRAGVPINWTKCHISDSVAEFAGYTIAHELMVRPGQWREPQVNNHLGIAKDLRTPLTGEVSLEWCEIQKIKLFIEGIYNPPVDQWSKYLRYASSVVKGLSLDPPGPLQCKLLWETGIRLWIRQSLGHLDKYGIILLMPIRTDWVAEIYRGLPPVDSVRQGKYMSSWFSDTSPDQIMVEAHASLINALASGEIDLGDFKEHVKRVTSNVRSLYWLPPETENDLGGVEHRRIAKALSAA